MGNNMTEPKCKMSIYIEEIDNDNICALAMKVNCAGLKKDTGCCPFWKRGDGEP